MGQSFPRGVEGVVESMRTTNAEVYKRNCRETEGLVFVECDLFNFVGNGASIGNRIEEN